MEDFIIAVFTAATMIGILAALVLCREPSVDDMLEAHMRKHGAHFPIGDNGRWFGDGMFFSNDRGIWRLTPEGWELVRAA